MQKISLILLLFSTVISNYLSAQKTQVTKSKEDGVYISLQAGLTIDRMKTSGYLIDYLKFDRPKQPYLSAIMDWDMGNVGELKGLVIRSEVEYKPMHFRAAGNANTDRYDQYEIKAHTIAPVVSVLYRVPWHCKFRPYGGIGVGMMWSTIAKNTLTYQYNKQYYSEPTGVYENYLDLDENNYLVVYTAGLMLGNRYDLNCRYGTSTWSRSDDVHHQLKSRSLTISFGYRL
jgi:hypothetical protein